MTFCSSLVDQPADQRVGQAQAAVSTSPFSMVAHCKCSVHLIDMRWRRADRPSGSPWRRGIHRLGTCKYAHPERQQLTVKLQQHL